MTVFNLQLPVFERASYGLLTGVYWIDNRNEWNNEFKHKGKCKWKEVTEYIVIE